jgi:hypothetical protein
MGTDRFRRSVPLLAGSLLRLLRCLPASIGRHIIASAAKRAQD